jgi:hypothetical protein
MAKRNNSSQHLSTTQSPLVTEGLFEPEAVNIDIPSSRNSSSSSSSSSNRRFQVPAERLKHWWSHRCRRRHVEWEAVGARGNLKDAPSVAAWKMPSVKQIGFRLGLFTYFGTLLVGWTLDPHSGADTKAKVATAACTILMIIWWLTEALPLVGKSHILMFGA